LVLVAGSAVCVACAFGERTGPEFWLAVIPVALAPYAVVAVAIRTARGGWWTRAPLGLGGLVVVAAGAVAFHEVAQEVRLSTDSTQSPPLRRLAWAVDFWLTVQGVAALATAIMGGLTWERRPRYGLWLLFAVGLCAFSLVADFTVQLEASVAVDWFRCLDALVAGRPAWYHFLPDGPLTGLGRIVLPAVLLGWLAQCAVPRRPRRMPDQAADYADGMPLRPAA
jgi:hypothetical protein